MKEVYIGIGVAVGVSALLCIIHLAGRFFFSGALVSWMKFEKRMKKIEEEVEDV